MGCKFGSGCPWPSLIHRWLSTKQGGGFAIPDMVFTNHQNNKTPQSKSRFPKTLDTTNIDQYTYEVEIEDQYVRSCSYPILSCHACRASEPMRHPAGTTLAVGFLFSAVVAGKSPYDEYFTQSPLVQTASL